MLLFAIIMADIMAAARLFVNYPATIGLIGVNIIIALDNTSRQLRQLFEKRGV